MLRRCDRNRKRSKSTRRLIYCPSHECLLDSVSEKHHLFANPTDVYQNRFTAKKCVVNQKNVPIREWLEAFWCPSCQKTIWYHVQQFETEYRLHSPSEQDWMRATGTVGVTGNPSVSEFSKRESRISPNQRLF